MTAGTLQGLSAQGRPAVAIVLSQGGLWLFLSSSGSKRLRLQQQP